MDLAAARDRFGQRQHQPAREPGKRSRGGGLVVLTLVVVALAVGQRWLIGFLDAPSVQTWTTIFISITVQALPFLVLGVLLSAAITTLVPPSFVSRALPRRPAFAVPTAASAGVLLPTCECASVPVAGGLITRGVAPAAALAFLLAAPAVNPVVLVATAVAFPGRPEVVGARFLASLTTAVVVGWLWLRLGRADWTRPRRAHPVGSNRLDTFRLAAQHDFLHAGGFLVVGGITAATLNIAVPRGALDAIADQPVVAVLALAALAVVLAICSEADAFVAASLTQFSMTSRLAFMVVGPTVDVKLVALQSGSFGRRFAVRFAPLTFVIALVASVTVGWWLL